MKLKILKELREEFTFSDEEFEHLSKSEKFLVSQLVECLDEKIAEEGVLENGF